ncbi:recombinase family protein [Vibrio sp. ER1A]|uniref:recombinase family protein n=1 Tax=Vibrio sp. ER1A TaxID=1517681 RepID=UPI00069171FE|nr:recombinase family protein [Vibrio sp. ER1A]
MATAYLYIRFSSKRQELGDSVKRQIERAEHFCRYNNLELSTQSFEDLGISAFKEGGKRPALADLIDCVKSGKIEEGSYILFEDTDRLSRRGFKTALDLTHELVECGVFMVTMGNGQIYDKQNIQNLSSTLPLLLDADRAHLESQRKSVLIKSAKRSIRESRVIKGKQPFWITIEDGVPVLNDKAEVAVKMIDYRLEGFSAQKIAKLLNQEGYKSPTGKQIGAALVKISIANSALYGAKTYFDSTNGMKVIEIVEDLYPPLCTKLVWNSLQYNKGTNQRGRTSKQAPFSKLFKCWKCGSALTTRSATRNNKKYSYRRCIGSLEGRCDQSNNYRDVDQIMLEQLSHLQYKKMTHKHTECDDVSLYQDKMVSLNQAKELLLSNPVALAGIYEDIVKTQQLLEEAIAKRDTLSNQPNEVDFEYIANLQDTSQQNQLLRRIIDKITFKKLSKWNCRAEVFFKNGHKISFVIKYGWYDYDVVFKSDTAKVGKWIETHAALEAWEVN